jgi:hypothetical protein
MAFGGQKNDLLAYSRSARTDVRPWAMFIIGAIFVLTSLSIDPQTNCNDAGECAPWLVPIAFVMGAAVGLSGLGMLLANPNRGSRIDPDSGELIWWQNRFGTAGGDEGRIHPSEISRIRIVKMSDGSDEVHLYDRAGARQYYFDEEVIGWDQERWAKAMTEHWPHIRVEIVE